VLSERYSSINAAVLVVRNRVFGVRLTVQQRKSTMAKPKAPRVIFKMQRIAEGDWLIEAHYPGADIRYIKGLKSKADVDDWLTGSRRIDWLRSQGYAK